MDSLHKAPRTGIRQSGVQSGLYSSTQKCYLPGNEIPLGTDPAPTIGLTNFVSLEITLAPGNKVSSDSVALRIEECNTVMHPHLNDRHIDTIIPFTTGSGWEKLQGASWVSLPTGTTVQQTNTTAAPVRYRYRVTWQTNTLMTGTVLEKDTSASPLTAPVLQGHNEVHAISLVDLVPGMAAVSKEVAGCVSFVDTLGVTHQSTPAVGSAVVGNLLIVGTTPANPNPILWNPATMTSVPLSVTITCGYTSNQPVTLRIFRSDQTPVTTLTKMVPIGGPNPATVSFVWDGTGNQLGTGQGTSVGTQMPKGVYLFEFQVGDPAVDYDQDKSALLGFGLPATGLTLGASDDSGETNTLEQNLADSYGTPPVSDHVDVYENWTLMDVMSQPIKAGLGQTYTELCVPQPSPIEPDEMVSQFYTIYLLSPQDGDRSHDKGHRNRFALQHNYANPMGHRVLTVGGHFPPEPYEAGDNMFGDALMPTDDIADFFTPLAKTLGGYGDCRERNEETDPRRLLQGAANDAWTLASGYDVAIFCGHGPPEKYAGGCFMFGTGKANGTPTLSNLYAEAMNDKFRRKCQETFGTSYSDAADNFGSLDTLKEYPWQKTQVVMWLGCDTSGAGGVGMPENTVYYGATGCSVGLRTIWDHNALRILGDVLSGINMRRHKIKDAVEEAVSAARCGSLFNKDPTAFYGMYGSQEYLH